MYLKNTTVFLGNQTIFHQISLLPVKIEGETIKVLVTLRLQKIYSFLFPESVFKSSAKELLLIIIIIIYFKHVTNYSFKSIMNA